MITKHSFYLKDPSPANVRLQRERASLEAANTRWYNELQVKYNVSYRDEEDYDFHGLLTGTDHTRYMEILNEERLAHGLPRR